ncbi:MAG: hypothetical protein VW891_05550 [Novosphingobium sp.]
MYKQSASLGRPSARRLACNARKVFPAPSASFKQQRQRHQQRPVTQQQRQPSSNAKRRLLAKIEAKRAAPLTNFVEHFKLDG